MKMLLTFILGLLAGPVLFGLVAIAGMLPSNSTAEPPEWEASLGMRALDASLEKRAKGLKNPVSPNDRLALAAGKKIYANNCSGCHGDAKGPSEWGARGFYPRPPQFFQEGADVNATEAYAAVHDGIRYSGMGAWAGQMKDADMWKVANFVASIRGPGGKQMDMD
ncbi:MAG: c-type cytochrome [Bacillota bacterium]